MYNHKRIVIIAALAENGVIGGDNQLLWHIPADLKRFKALTWGHAIVMGRKTHDSIGKPLPGRQNVVLSRQMPPAPLPGSLFWTHSWEEAIACAHSQEVFVIGGASLYELALPCADRLELTRVHRAFEGDTVFPAWDPQGFERVEREEHLSADAEGLSFAFETYDRLFIAKRST